MGHMHQIKDQDSIDRYIRSCSKWHQLDRTLMAMRQVVKIDKIAIELEKVLNAMNNDYLRQDKGKSINSARFNNRQTHIFELTQKCLPRRRMIHDYLMSMTDERFDQILTEGPTNND
jgi:hypothetical protein